LGANDPVSRQRRTHLTADDGLTENISAEARVEGPPSTPRITRSRKSFESAFVMASLRESDAEDSLNSALLGILLRRIRFSPNEKCSKLLKSYINAVTLNQRVPGSRPDAPTISI